MRIKIKYINKIGNLHERQQEFVSVILELCDMAKKDKFFNFIIGVKPWGRNEVKRQKIKTLEDAFDVIDRMVDHYDEGTGEKKKKSEKPKESLQRRIMQK